MQKTALLLLALSAAWAPATLAFPPCPQFPVDLTPIGGPTRVGYQAPPWFSGVFALQGHPGILDRIAPPGSLGGDIIHSGKCRKVDRLPVLSDHAGHDVAGAIPALAPDGGFGTIGLPDLRLSDPGMALVYTLSFTVDGAPLALDWEDHGPTDANDIQWSAGAAMVDSSRIDPPWGGSGTSVVGVGGVPSDFYLETQYFGIAVPDVACGR